MGRWRSLICLLVLSSLGAACGTGPDRVAFGGPQDDVRFPVEGDSGDDLYASGSSSKQAHPRSSSGAPLVDQEIPFGDDVLPGERPPTANICGASGVIETGPVVQFPWAPPCVEPDLAPEAATARGVSRTEIKVAYYVTGDPKIQQAMERTGGCGQPTCIARYARDYAAWFNRYYELYGRRVVVEPFQGAASESSASLAVADADALADAGYFAVLAGPQEAGARFASRLASRGVICICTVSLPEGFYEDHAPYVWSWLMSSTQAYVHRAQYVTQRLAGRKAVWAGSPAMRARTRSFGLVWFDDGDGYYGEGVDFFTSRLRNAGVELAASLSYKNIEGCQTGASDMVLRLLDADVTSVIFAGDPLCPTPLTNAAQARGASWEWIITGSILTDTNQFGRLYDQTQWRRAFGVSMLTPEVKSDREYWARMIREIDPDIELKENMATVLHPFVPFFTGLHMAGPNLNAVSFARGLRAAPARGGTVTIPRRSYGRKVIDGMTFEDYTSYDDMTEIWWDADATDPNGDAGAYRYVGRGKRFRWDGWPATTPNVFKRLDAIVGYARPPDQ